MKMVEEHEGTEIWECDECPRRLLIEWFPSFIVRMITKGDDSEYHSGEREENKDER